MKMRKSEKQHSEKGNRIWSRRVLDFVGSRNQTEGKKRDRIGT